MGPVTDPTMTACCALLREEHAPSSLRHTAAVSRCRAPLRGIRRVKSPQTENPVSHCRVPLPERHAQLGRHAGRELNPSKLGKSPTVTIVRLCTRQPTWRKRFGRTQRYGSCVALRVSWAAHTPTAFLRRFLSADGGLLRCPSSRGSTHISQLNAFVALRCPVRFSEGSTNLNPPIEGWKFPGYTFSEIALPEVVHAQANMVTHIWKGSKALLLWRAPRLSGHLRTGWLPAP